MRSSPSPHYKTLLESGVVSKPYACQIANGTRVPSLAMALKIYRATGLKFGKLKEASSREITTMERVVGVSP